MFKGTYYSIYAEAHIGEKWYNINPLIKKQDGSLRACPIIEGQSWLRDAYDKLERILRQWGITINTSYAEYKDETLPADVLPYLLSNTVIEAGGQKIEQSVCGLYGLGNVFELLGKTGQALLPKTHS
ncbi:hypothetical protein CE91St62_10520 [Lachnospiraceae bacterium]|uniref:hypothetical protein n=1 Tax=Extibacter sp. GGCC_0201 TaxID=2731209 RepID=UPI001AA1A8E2|nr:hypothetical protein [Extibacter sp. GGCC_0201]BDF32987.1 hypothetical protein CE91St61_10620 [Lachnospiraceae bacterium]BDF36991.1 hypothetical protein CE91St62_10520 [Lachnospiraceae bacterium]